MSTLTATAAEARAQAAPVSTRRHGIAIEMSGIAKAFGRLTVLDNVDLSMGAGEFVTLLGPSGSGKTTLLMAIAGFIHPDAGQIRFADTDVTNVPPEKRDIGMVFQNYALFPHMSVADNVAFPLRARRVGRAEIEERVNAALERVQMGAFGDRRPEKLSGGQRQRIALARALVFEPKLLLMDEPLSALDKSLREQMQLEIRSLQQRLGITTISVTHDQREALAMADRIAILHQGRIAQYGTSREVFEKPANAFVAAFMGDAVLVPVERRDGALFAAGAPLRHEGPTPDGQLSLVVRAENASIAAAPIEGNTNLPGRLVSSSYQGSEMLHAVLLEGGIEIFVRQRSYGVNPVDAPEGRVWVSLEPGQTLVVPQ